MQQGTAHGKKGGPGGGSGYGCGSYGQGIVADEDLSGHSQYKNFRVYDSSVCGCFLGIYR